MDVFSLGFEYLMLWFSCALMLRALFRAPDSPLDVSAWVYHKHFYLSFNETELLVLPLHLFLYGIPRLWHRHLHLIPKIYKPSLVFPLSPTACASQIYPESTHSAFVHLHCRHPGLNLDHFFLFGNPNPLSPEQPGIVLVMLPPCFNIFSRFSVGFAQDKV